MDLVSISMNKNEPKPTAFHKYDIEASIDEIENTESHSTYKYGFAVLSNPKSIRLAVDGVTRIIGDPKERDEILTKDENDIPKILSIIYQELFPTFFLLSKSLNVSCPPYRITMVDDVSNTQSTESKLITEFRADISDAEEIKVPVEQEPEKADPPAM